MAHQYTTMVLGWINVNNVQPCRCSANGIQRRSDVVMLSGLMHTPRADGRALCRDVYASRCLCWKLRWIIPMVVQPKVLGLTLDPKLTYSTYKAVIIRPALEYAYSIWLPLQGLPNLIGRWLPTGQPSITIWLPNNDWWLPNSARHKMLTFGG